MFFFFSIYMIVRDFFRLKCSYMDRSLVPILGFAFPLLVSILWFSSSGLDSRESDGSDCLERFSLSESESDLISFTSSRGVYFDGLFRMVP